MEKIEFKDLPDTTTPLSASNLNTMQDNIEDEFNKKELEYIIATINAPQTIASETQVNLNDVARSQGNFTLNNGKIIIGAGIHHVRASACMFVDNWAGGSYYLWALLQLNNHNASTSINGSPSSFLSSSIPTTIFSVTEGDEIRLVADSPSGGTLRRYAEATWLCVEKID